MLAFLAASFASPTVEITRTVEIAPGVEMPRVNLGTCCGSEATHSFPAWYAAGGRGVDTALDYGKEAPGGKQTELAAAIAAAGVPRSSVFITTKIRAGFDLAHGGPLCVGVSAEHALSQVRQDVAELNVTHVDLVLLHAPCLTDGANYALWQGLEEAHALNLTRAIGVSNYKAKQLSALIAKADKKPSVNQCLFSVAHHDDETLDYCKANGVQYEAYEAMRGCPFSDAKVNAIAANYGVGVSQLCLRWVLQHGAALAVGLGSNESKMSRYAASNLDVYSFNISAADMAFLDALA